MRGTHIYVKFKLSLLFSLVACSSSNAKISVVQDETIADTNYETDAEIATNALRKQIRQESEYRRKERMALALENKSLEKDTSPPCENCFEFCGKLWPANEDNIICHDDNLDSLNSLLQANSLESLTVKSQQPLDVSVLEHLPSLKDLNIRADIASLSSFSKLKGLRHLSIGGYKGIECSALGNLDRLEILNFYDGNLSNIECVKSLRQLIELHLTNVPVSDLSALNSMRKLKNIWASDLPIANLDSLRENRSLIYIRIQHSKLTNIDGVENIVTLGALQFDGNPLEKLPSLKNLRRLRFLSVRGTRVTSLCNLSWAKNLVFLGLDHTGISDLSPLAKLKKLEIVRLECTQVKVEDILKLPKYSLKGLSLEGTGIKTLAFVDNFPNLYSVSIQRITGYEKNKENLGKGDNGPFVSYSGNVRDISSPEDCGKEEWRWDSWPNDWAWDDSK